MDDCRKQRFENTKPITMLAILKKKINDAAKKAASALTTASEKLSSRQKKIVLILFSLLCVLFCLFAIMQTVRQRERTHFKFMPLQVPQHIGKNFSVPGPV